jgi:hypothetical protein
VRRELINKELTVVIQEFLDEFLDEVHVSHQHRTAAV